MRWPASPVTDVSVPSPDKQIRYQELRVEMENLYVDDGFMFVRVINSQLLNDLTNFQGKKSRKRTIVNHEANLDQSVNLFQMLLIRL